MKKHNKKKLNTVFSKTRKGLESGNGSIYIIFIVFALSVMSFTFIGGGTPSIRGKARPPQPHPTAIQQGNTANLQQDPTISPSVSPSF